jgi:7-carboxy-7-deazaguanine synthase
VAGAAGRLKVTEVFHSLQGEAVFSGWPTVFIRLTGCPLRCQYCDTAYAFSGGEWATIDELLERTRSFGTRHVCVTGGEPLAQPACVDLLRALCDQGLEVSLETSGAIDIGDVDDRVCRVVDVKTPASGEVAKNIEANVALLSERDVVKFVICDRGDYEWSKRWLSQHPEVPSEIFFSPSFDELGARELGEWILEDRLPVRLQLQLHKLLWGDSPGH